MEIDKTSVEGAFVVELPTHLDPRGSFKRMFCKSTFENAGLNVDWVQHNLSTNPEKFTLRGMHYQAPPFEEIKLVTCVGGRIIDSIIDVRKESPTYLKTFTVELDSNENKHIYIPKGVAHGYQTLSADSSVFYLVSTAYEPQANRGIRYDDKAFALSWPAVPSFISESDKSWLDFKI